MFKILSDQASESLTKSYKVLFFTCGEGNKRWKGGAARYTPFVAFWGMHLHAPPAFPLIQAEGPHPMRDRRAV
jgi:hypothetical protein